MSYPAQDNARPNLPLLIGVVVALSVPAGLLLHEEGSLSLCSSIFIVACGLVLMWFAAITVREWLARRRALRRGARCTAVVIARDRKVWCLGWGGDSCFLTLRYDRNGFAVQSRRAVRTTAWLRHEIGDTIEVCLTPRQPRRWYVVDENAWGKRPQ